MKSVYYIGEKIDADTIVEKGMLHEDTQEMFIEYAKDRYQFYDIK